MGAGNDHLLPVLGLQGNGQQHRVGLLPDHAQAVAGGQIGISDPQGVAVGVNETVADAGEIKGAQQGIHDRRSRPGGAEAGPPIVELLIDVELGPFAGSDRCRHQNETLLRHILRQEQGLLGRGRCSHHQGQTGPQGR